MLIETVTDKQGKVSYKFIERYEHPYTGKMHKDRVGHSDPDTTLKIYNHVTSKQKATIADKLNTL